jgi:hypothetical protein
MQTPDQPTKKAALLSDDGELRIDTPHEDSATLSSLNDKPKKTKEKGYRPIFTSGEFWLISSVYTVIFYILVVLSFVVSRVVESALVIDFFLLLLLPMSIVTSIFGFVRYRSSNRRIAFGFLGGLIGIYIVVPIILLVGAVLISAMMNSLSTYNVYRYT